MPCSSSSTYIFTQINHILNRLEEADYVQPLDVFNGSTLGQHFRHILDFYSCVVKGASHGEVNYGCRDRSVSIETNIKLAQDQFAQLQGQIDGLSDDQVLGVVTDFHKEAGDGHEVVQSSVGRELMFAYDHAIHHMAMIRIGIRDQFSYVDIDGAVGMASSTINHSVSIH